MDEIKEYLENVKLPEYESPDHRRELRRKLSDEIVRRQKMATRRRVLRIVYILAALICISALAIAGVTYTKWRFKEKRDGAYIFTPEQDEPAKDGKAVFRSFTVRSTDPDFTMSEDDIKQTERDIEEMDVLAQQDKREIVKVIETELEGEIGRTYIFKYILSDGRERTVGDNDGEGIPEKVLSVNVKEVYELRKEGKGEKLEPVEKDIRGKTFVFDRQKIKLSDGREIIHSIGEPKDEKANQ